MNRARLFSKVLTKEIFEDAKSLTNISIEIES